MSVSGDPSLTLLVEQALDRGHGAQHLGDLDLALARGDLSVEDRAQLLHLRSRVHRQGLAFQSMLADATAAAHLFESLDDRASQARAAGMAAIAAAESGDVFVAADLAVRARVASSGDGAGDPWVLNRIGIFCHQMYDIRAALHWWRRGVEAARAVADAASEILLRHNIVEGVYTATRLGDLERSAVCAELDAAEEGARWLARTVDGRPRMPVDGARLLALVFSVRGRHDDALVALDQARNQLDGTSAPLVRAAYDAAEGFCVLGAGNPAGALTALDRALVPRPADAVDTETLLVRTDRADALDQLGRSAEALAEVRRAGEILVARLRRQGQGVLREVDLRARHDVERSQLLRHRDTLVHDMQRDPLTDAGNRRRLDTLTAQLRDRSLVGACVVDLDRFKQVNDRFGHALGDAVLVATVHTLTACCRSGDEVVRLGGEEFLVLCPDGDAEATADVAERARVAIEGHDWSAIRPGLHVTASVGSASGHGARLGDTIGRADAALLVAKREGRNRARRAHPAMRISDWPAVG